MLGLTRRAFIAGGLAGVGLAAGRAEGLPRLTNPCLEGLPQDLAEHPLVRDAWTGLDPAEVWDAHAHLAGLGDGNTGIAVQHQMAQPRNPVSYLQRFFYLNASCTRTGPGSVDARYVARLRHLVAELPPGCKALLFAFDWAHDEKGAPLPERSTLYVPDAYAKEVARQHPERFEWAASIHPYRADAVEALERAAAEGARAVKWLPPAQNIDAASPRCDTFYRALARLRLPLIVHVGEERAMAGAAAGALGNPLRLRRPLALGVRLVAAHCASLGKDRDLDRGLRGPVVKSFDLFARLMDEGRGHGELYGDISAMTQANRAGAALAAVLTRQDWHPRLLNGSDYPLPGVMPLVRPAGLAQAGFLDAAAVPVLEAIRRYNPLLFDFVLKRQLRWKGQGFQPCVFETRRVFAATA